MDETLPLGRIAGVRGGLHGSVPIWGDAPADGETMSKRTRVGPRDRRARCGARLPSARAGRRSPLARGAGDDWVLLPDGTWRRVQTIRVRSLFG